MRSANLRVSYLTSGQYNGHILHYFQCQEVRPPPPNSNNVVLVRRVFALADEPQFFSDPVRSAQRCVQVSQVQEAVITFDSVLFPQRLSDYDVMCQNTPTLDFTRIIAAAFTIPRSPDDTKQMIILHLDSDVGSVIRCRPVNPQVISTHFAPTTVTAQPRGLSDAEMFRIAEVCSENDQLRRKIAELENSLVMQRRYADENETSLKEKIFRLESHYGNRGYDVTPAPVVPAVPHYERLNAATYYDPRFPQTQPSPPPLSATATSPLSRGVDYRLPTLDDMWMRK
eukprot:PhF_6_TR1469/c0_g1_i1/m.2646